MTTTDSIRAALDGIRGRDKLAELFMDSVTVIAAQRSQADVAPMLAALEAVLIVVDEYPIPHKHADPTGEISSGIDLLGQAVEAAIQEHLGGLNDEH